MANQSYNPKPTLLQRELRRDSYERQCMGKIRYLGQRDASWRFNQMQERKVGGWDRLEIYDCPHCDGFHIGHAPLPLTPEKAAAMVKDFERQQSVLLSSLTDAERADLAAELKFLESNPEMFRELAASLSLPPEFLEIAAGSLLRLGFSN